MTHPTAIDLPSVVDPKIFESPNLQQFLLQSRPRNGIMQQPQVALPSNVQPDVLIGNTPGERSLNHKTFFNIKNYYEANRAEQYQSVYSRWEPCKKSYYQKLSFLYGCIQERASRLSEIMPWNERMEQATLELERERKETGLNLPSFLTRLRDHGRNNNNQVVDPTNIPGIRTAHPSPSRVGHEHGGHGRGGNNIRQQRRQERRMQSAAGWLT